MASPIVYVDRSEIVDGRYDELMARIDDLAGLVAADEPQIVAYSVYVDADRRSMTVIHAHADPESFATHFRVTASAFEGFVALIRLRSIDVYGDVAEDLVAPLRAKARLLGDATVTVHPYRTGFIRSGAVAVERPGTSG